jgi:uncharacterized hydrophobic protein (TIGR00271 family)
VPLLRITCPGELTDRIVEVLRSDAHATELAVVPGASRLSGGDLVLAEIPRSAVDDFLALLPSPDHFEGVHVAVEQSEQLRPASPNELGDEAVVWAEVVQEVHIAGRLSWINTLLIVTAACIAALGIIQDQLLLIVGAMALSPDYYPIADTCLSLVRRAWRHAAGGAVTLAASFGAAAVGAWVLSEFLAWTNLIAAASSTNPELTVFISQPDRLSVVVALFAGVAGALAITLPQTRGLVGVFVSITTIPAAANMGVAVAARDWGELEGATVQLVVNVVSLLVSGTVTLAVRHRHRVWSTLQP